MSSESDIIAKTPAPATVTSLTADLHTLGLAAGDVVIVHSSLSSLGWVAGGPQAVVLALLAAVSPGGTIVMPTQSGSLTDPGQWSNPPVPEAWVDTIRENLPAYDPDLTPTRQMGQIVDCFRSHRATMRSAHPVASFAANGVAAEAIVGAHPLTPALGESSPLGRLYEMDAKVLLLGVTHANNTSLHLAEYRAEWSGKVDSRQGAAMLVDGVRKFVWFEDLATDEADFDNIGSDFAASGEEVQGTVAIAPARLFRQRTIVDFGVTWIEANR